MKVMPVVPRTLTNRDINDAIACCLSEGAEQAALGFIDALEQAYAHIVNADSKLTHFCNERRFKTDTPPLHLNTA